jgi:hypothetical protein
MHSGDPRAHIRVVTATTYQKLIYFSIDYSFPSRGRLLLRSTTEEDPLAGCVCLGASFCLLSSASIAGYMRHKMDRGRAECLPQPLA